MLARVLSRHAPADRPRRALAVLAEAELADRHRRHTGRIHRSFGDGSLMVRCMLLFPPAEPMADDGDFLTCLALAALAMRLHSKA